MDLADDLVGSGFFDIFGKSARAVYNEFFNPQSLLRSRVGDVRRGIRRDYPPAVRQILQTYGNYPIVGATLRRDPLESFIHNIFQAITLGQWEDIVRQSPYDKLFHLGVVVLLQTPQGIKPLLIEKNEVINIQTPKPLDANTQILAIPTPSPPITLYEFLSRAQRAMGDRYFLYDPFVNNCQDFIATLLRESNMYPPYAQSFVKQETSSILSMLPSYSQRLARGITDFAAVLNVALEGGGTHRENFLKKHNLPLTKSLGIDELSKLSGVPEDILLEVYRRGIGAAKTQPTSVRLKGSYVKNVNAPPSKKLSKEQWAFARIYSFLDGNPKHDNDLRANIAKIGSGGGLKDPRGEQYGRSEAYLKEARRRAKAHGYDPSKLEFAEDGEHKLQITDPQGRIHKFGRRGYGDHLIWSHLEKLAAVPKGYARQKQNTFQSSHSQMKGNWRKNPFSANNLALRILW
jgi:hypothetical protein